MTINQKNKIITLHPFLDLQLAYMAVVNFDFHIYNGAMAVNRLLLVFEDNGCGNSKINNPSMNQEFFMRAGFIYFIPCNQEIELNITSDISFISLHFNLDLYYGFDIFKEYKDCVMTENPALVSKTKQLLNQDNDIKTLCHINNVIFNFCTSLNIIQPDDAQKSVFQKSKYEKILEFVERECDATTTVAMLAEMNDMRQDVFSRKFTHDMGETPKNFISMALMRKASKMLLIPNISVRKVAENLNFSSEYYFSRFFKKHTGTPPSLFRKLNEGK